MLLVVISLTVIYFLFSDYYTCGRYISHFSINYFDSNNIAVLILFCLGSLDTNTDSTELTPVQNDYNWNCSVEIMWIYGIMDFMC